MRIIDELLSPLSFEDFKKTYLFKEPYAAPEKAERFRNLLSWPLLEAIMASGHKDCWLPLQGLLPEQKELATGTLQSSQALAGLQQGRTLLVRHAEKTHGVLRRIASDFESVFQCPIDIQLYSTPAGQEGFNWHFDVEDVFVIQSIGEKEFRLRKNTLTPRPLPRPEKLPKDLQFEKETERQEIRCHLKAGDWLYIPAGYWHKAKAITDSSHLSVGVMAGPFAE